MAKIKPVAIASAMLISATLAPAVADSTTVTTSSTFVSVSSTLVSSSSTSLPQDYDNDLLVAVYPTAPIASLSLHVTAFPDYGEDDASCFFFGPGDDPAGFRGKKDFSFSSLPGGVLDRSQSIVLCGYYTHEPHGPLSAGDFGAAFLEARDAGGELVETVLCPLQFSTKAIAPPAADGCRYACGDAICDGGEPKASDALAVLRAALELYECDLHVCDVDSSGSILAGDALGVLRRSVNLPVALLCHAPPDCLG